MKRTNLMCLVFVFVLLGAASSFAQNAALVGTVRDSQQAVIPGAMVTLTNSATGVQMDTKVF